METEIKEALIGILDGIAQSDTQSVSDGLMRIETCLQSARTRLNPQLVHFLERRSYAKALAYVEEKGAGRDLPG